MKHPYCPICKFPARKLEEPVESDELMIHDAALLLKLACELTGNGVLEEKVEGWMLRYDRDYGEKEVLTEVSFMPSCNCEKGLSWEATSPRTDTPELE